MQSYRSLFLVSAAMMALPMTAQETAKKEAPAEEAAANSTKQAPNQIAFSNLPQAVRETYLKHRTEAQRLFNDKRVFETINEVQEAQKTFKDDPELINLLGSCYVEFRDFDKAKACFDEATKLAPGLTSILFNIAEMEFVTRDWKNALAHFQELLKKLPAEETATRRIAEFKILLCHQALGNHKEAEKLAQLYDPIFDNSPHYYYAQAAICFHNENIMKAEEWMAIANRVFNNAAIIAPWQDTFIEFGYIKSFYGGEQAALENADAKAPE